MKKFNVNNFEAGDQITIYTKNGFGSISKYEGKLQDITEIEYA